MPTTAASHDSANTRPKRKPLWLRLLRTVALTWVGVTLLLTFIQRKLIYIPTHAASLPASAQGNDVFDVTIATEDGVTLHGWHWPANRNPDSIAGGQPVVLFFHGNGGHRGHRVPDCRYLNSLGADVLIFDYRGYAENAGSPSEEGLAADARAAWNYATAERGVAPQRIVLLGSSLGGGVAIRLAADQCEAGVTPGGLLLKSTFASLVETAAHHYRFLPVRLVLRDRYPSIDRIDAIKCPILSIHGDTDRVVPLFMGRELFDAAPAQSADGTPKRFVELPGTGHNFHLDEVTGRVAEPLRQFLARLASAES